MDVGGFLMVTLDSSIADIYASPVGHDVLTMACHHAQIPTWVLQTRLMKVLKIKSLSRFTKDLDENFYQTLIQLINAEQDTPPSIDGEIKHTWWKEAVFYQIYPRTFMDSNHDGIGDLQGIIDRLDYLKDLGVDALWLSPIYDSPLDDNGYDIRDYYKIHHDLGTMDDFKRLLQEVHKRDMKLIMDLVVNHTSDEHRWFQEALKDPNSPYRNYYFLYPQDNNTPPNNWESFFSGSAWNKYEEEKLWGLHLFSKKQMDLNWDNPDLRKDIIQMINDYLDLGVDGFRMDVINLISKTAGLPDGNVKLGKMMGYCGIEHYFYGPHLHEYLHEIHEKAFKPHNAFSVGEVPGLSMALSQMVTSDEREELDMAFSFDLLESPGHTRYEDYRYDLNAYRDQIHEWMTHYGNHCWMALFYNNHDNPRMVSKVDNTHQYDQQIATLLAIMQMTLKGTPFIFQGDEMGLTNYNFTSINQIHDIEGVNLYQELIKTMSEEEAFKIIKAGTRDHTRMMLPWNKASKETMDSLYQDAHVLMIKIYKELIHLRKTHQALIYGDYHCLSSKHNTYIYERATENETCIIECNLSNTVLKAHNYPDMHRVFPSRVENSRLLGPYEARIYIKVTSNASH